ncbi:MAG: DUF2461 domain-containing protein [Chitinophagales bacterium]|nr:DUF2461 domain-containing protein [Chitinophagales bacterium]
MLQNSTLRFLKTLKKNNSKPWFDANRKLYESAKADFAGFIQSVIIKHGLKDASIKDLIAKDCMFRINRDIRFSKDKSPYKTNFGASINKGGRKAFDAAGYYFHLEPGNSFVGGGIYMPMPEHLKKVRQEIDYNLKDFKKILSAKKFKTVYGDISRGDEFSLSRVPKGYEPDNPAAEYLKLKSYIAMTRISDADLTSSNLLKKTVAAFEALHPLIIFLNHSFSE